MLDEELFRISEKISENVDLEEKKKRDIKEEKQVIDIIKKYAFYADDNGMIPIRVLSHESKDDYIILNNIIRSGKRKYYEKEYALYLINKESVDGYIQFDVLEFIWNSREYYEKHNSKDKQKNFR